MRFITICAVLATFVGMASAGLAQGTVLYSFGSLGISDPGAVSGLAIDKNGNLYGTFNATVFELERQQDGSWAGNTIYAFLDGGNQGPGLLASPNGVTVDSSGNLYGTAVSGCGYAFELTPGQGGKWSEKTIHTFTGSDSDGCLALGSLILDKNGNLYGTTRAGGADDLGTVFELIREPNGEWTEKLLHGFAGQPGDGTAPEAGLIFDQAGNLYGTTSNGGQYNWGTVFELLPQSDGTWDEKVIHSFCPLCEDGYYSVAGLTVDSKGHLFGTTLSGADATSLGAIFELSPEPGGAWNETVLYSFNVDRDGNAPAGELLVDSRGNLFGTTNSGGVNESGTIFELSPGSDGTWTEKVLCFFWQDVEGWFPQAGLVSDALGNLYGTTSGGGILGDGMAYELADPDRTQTPQFFPAGGMFTSTVPVTINEGSSGATIYYTTDGTNPSVSSTRYQASIQVDKTETIKAIAIADDLEASEIATAKYTIETPTPAPKFSLAPGTYHRVEHLLITDAISGADIYYTTTGAMPTNTSKRYLASIKMSASETIKAIAIANGHTPSGVTSANYSIHLPPAATPKFYPKAGEYAAGQKIDITEADAGATIYYTTDGTTPATSSKKYPSMGLVLEKPETIKAIAVGPGYSTSSVASASYTMK